jgi:hypothetical protein
MTVFRLFAIGVIVACTTAAWFMLAAALKVRTESTGDRLEAAVAGNLGNSMVQEHPGLYYLSSTSANMKRHIQPVRSRVNVRLDYAPRNKGLIKYRAYDATFDGEYVIRNPTPITQTIYIRFAFPARDSRYDKFTLSIGGKVTDRMPANGEITESVILEPGVEVPLKVTYESTGRDQWVYSFGNTNRVRNFDLRMQTNFEDINMPAGTESPTDRAPTADGMNLAWEYSDVIGARSIGMDMPAVVNPGPVASRMTFFAPVSLLFFFAVLVIMGTVKQVNLHPVNYFFLAAGCFTFQLLFAYLVDLIPSMLAFVIAAIVSLLLVSGYLWRVAGIGFARIAAIAQFAYMVLFSYSFFFPGLTGITITIGAILTLALLMAFTAKVDWNTIFVSRRKRRTGTPEATAPLATPPPIQ